MQVPFICISVSLDTFILFKRHVLHCSIDERLLCSDKPGYVDEADQFKAHPLSFLYSMFSSLNLEVLPSHIVLFDSMEKHISAFFQAEGYVLVHFWLSSSLCYKFKSNLFNHTPFVLLHVFIPAAFPVISVISASYWLFIAKDSILIFLVFPRFVS